MTAKRDKMIKAIKQQAATLADNYIEFNEDNCGAEVWDAFDTELDVVVDFGRYLKARGTEDML